ncbi:MAG: alkyl hydroperoxide reductase subunit F [Tannerella sp.]|jgi:alkyl hydroperoxide reductase subunit F|nr:alkyl hydroperoxide reductase subunit F [Tannerella sp.]
MLDNSIKEQLKSIFADLNNAYLFDIYVSDHHESRSELIDLLEGVASTSDKISCQINPGDELAFFLLKNGRKTGIKFRGVPTGHEFTSLLMAILNSDGKGKNIPDEGILKRVRGLKGPIHLTTYVSLTCTNCPDVVQALNLMAVLHPGLEHEMVDGAINQEEVDKLKIQGVPTVIADGQILHVGRGDFSELLSKLENLYGLTNDGIQITETKYYDMLIIGGGPAGSSASIYLARKGLNVGIVADRIGGQVMDTVDINNLISVCQTTGKELAANLKTHIHDYPIEVLEHRRVESVAIEGRYKVVTTNTGEKFAAPAIIIATGASWRKLNVPGETDYIGRGVAFCPHCDGPFYKGKEVAVIGGGNSGIEAAIDLAGICSKVTVFEFMETLKADKVLQDKAISLPNVEIVLNTQTTEVIGNGENVTALRVKDRATEKEYEVKLDGIFVQIGLKANSEPFQNIINANRIGEIEVDTVGRTNIPGIYAAGDVTTIPYKQIIISMGDAAKVALTAFDDSIRGVF